MIGDGIRVTVVNIRAESAMLEIETDSDSESTTHQEQRLMTRDQMHQITPEVSLTVVDVRGDKVRLGFVCPSSYSVHRKEVYEAIKRENRRAEGLDTPRPSGESRNPVSRTTVVLKVDQVLHIGEKLTASPTDIDPAGVRLLVRGELLGGPDDGQRVNEAKELGINSVLTLGALISLSLVGADDKKAMFHLIAPSHVKIQVDPPRES